jgi:hypothetical protein
VGGTVDLEKVIVHSGIYEASMSQTLNYSTDASCLLVRVYLLHINSIVSTGCVVVTVRIVKKIMQMFLACTVHAGCTVVLASPSLRCRIIVCV